MNGILPWFLLLAVVAAACGFLIARRTQGAGTNADMDHIRKEHRETADRLVQKLEQESRTARTELRDNLTARMQELAGAQVTIGEGMNSQLEAMRKSTDERIERIRVMVDEKLQETLEKRMVSSFKAVTDNLQKVYEGLGEMRELAQDVGGLKSVLSGVRTRGMFGEFQLEMLLEESLSPGQFVKNVSLGGVGQVVEFAICLPGAETESGSLLLPLDAKFPVQLYERLQDTAEESREEAEKARKAFHAGLKKQAKEITKYISPPVTTNFALMYLPVDGMYAEALRTSETWGQIRNECNVIIVGPTTLYALLQSLLIGFKSIAISERSAEVWELLQEVNAEFRKFSDAVGKTAKKLDEARNAVESMEKSSKNMQKKIGRLSSGDQQAPAVHEDKALPADE